MSRMQSEDYAAGVTDFSAVRERLRQINERITQLESVMDQVEAAQARASTSTARSTASSIRASAVYTPSNVTPLRTFDASTITAADLADVVGTLVQDLQSIGILR